MVFLKLLQARFNSLLDVTLVQSLRNEMNAYSMVSVVLFVIASTWQFHVHSVLASLRPSRDMKPIYSTPPRSSLSFQLFLTPHYTSEILIYLALTLLIRSWTMFTAFLWVIASLSVSAGETREWVQTKFKGDEWGRWNILPFIY